MNKTQPSAPISVAGVPPAIDEFDDYKVFLRSRIERSSGVKGYGRRLAEAAGCHPSFLSHVLNGPTHLTPDQAAGLADFWALDEVETEIFLALVQRARAAAPALRKLLDRKLAKLKSDKRDLGKRFGAPRLPEAEAALYYSSWLWAAVHVLTSVSRYSRVEGLSARLGVPAEAIASILVGLEKMGLVESNGGRWSRTSKTLHLPKSSPLYTQHLLNWRSRALVGAVSRGGDAIHYSAVHGLSIADAERLRAMILRFLDDTRAVVEPSVEEEAFCINLDWFPV